MSDADKNTETVRRGYAAFNAGDLATLTEIFDENSSWHTPGRGTLAGDHTGREAAFGYFGRLGGDTAGTFRANLKHLYASADGRVVGFHQNTAKRNGKNLDISCCIVFEFKNGKIVDGREHIEDLYAWDAFWS
jgi:ketosteroid isomerase-like protein